MSGKWLSDYDTASSKADEATAAINERDRLARLGQNTAKATSLVRRLLNELAMLLQGLEDQLNTAGNKNHITEAEFSRRQNMVSTLKGRRDDLQSKFSRDDGPRGVNDHGRGQLFGGRESGDDARRMRRDEPESFRGRDVNGIMDAQQMVMREQDKGIDLLAESIARQKQMGLRIGNELEDQNEMLDELGEAMDNTDRRLVQETGHVVKVTERAKSSGMMCCIVLLILAIIGVAAAPI
eukprot:m.332721 g.332721  ORF g.332721 m.332721 type:complete len:238 (+) comp16995_c0_seq1:125-838(+)